MKVIIRERKIITAFKCHYFVHYNTMRGIYGNQASTRVEIICRFPLCPKDKVKFCCCCCFFLFQSKGDKPQCKSNAHVCTSIMKYPDGREFDEGPYCQCPGCSSKWQTDDYKSLSWPHYERGNTVIAKQ